MATGEITGPEIGGAAGALVSLIVAATGLLRLHTRVVEAEERAAKASAEVKELRDALGAKVAAEVERAVAELPKPRALPARSTSGSMPSVDTLRTLVREESARLVRERDEEHDRALERLGERIDKLLVRALDMARGEP